MQMLPEMRWGSRIGHLCPDAEGFLRSSSGEFCLEKNGKKGTRVFRKGTLSFSISSCHLEKIVFMLGTDMRQNRRQNTGGGWSVGEGAIAVVE